MHFLGYLKAALAVRIACLQVTLAQEANLANETAKSDFKHPIAILEATAGARSAARE